MKENVYDMLVIGGGPGGYTAALYAARAGLKVLVLEKLYAGGQMALTTEIENYPGFPQGIDGFTLAQQMKQGAERFGAESKTATVLSVDLTPRIKEISTDEGTFCARTVVIATGATPRELGIPREKDLTGKGVHYCAHCDAMFYRGKTVAVVGGGNSAAADALLLSRVAEKVILIHRRDTLRGEKITQKALQEAENVEFLWNSAVTELQGTQRLTGLTVTDLKTGKQQVIACDALFVSIGRNPATELVAGQLALDEGGYIPGRETTQTEIPGVYAVGDVRAKALRQIVTAVADGAVAAHMAEGYLQ